MLLNLDRIAPDPDQPRKLFDAAELEILAASIQQNGLMQPITVRPAEEKGRYWIVAGERRWRAHCLLRDRGYEPAAKISAIVSVPPTIADLRVRQIVENIARADLSLLEEARSYSGLLDIGMTEADAAARLRLPALPFHV